MSDRRRLSTAAVIAAAGLAAAVFAAAPAAHAQNAGESRPAAKKPTAKPARVIRLEEVTIEGRIQKPQAFYILPRKSLNMDVLELKESFLPKIVQSVEKEPF